MRTSEVVVVGGGVIGASVAFFLAREGIEVTLLERDALAAGASGAAAGMLTPTNDAADAGPFFHWAQRSLEGFESLAAELLERSGVDCEFVRSGTLRLAFDDDDVTRLQARADTFADARLEWFDAAAVRVVEPYAAEHAVGGSYAPDEAHVRSPLLARAYAAAARRFGARIETGVEATGLRVGSGRVTGVETRDGAWSTPRVVLCSGAWSATGGVWPEGLARLPVAPLRGQILSVEAPTPAPATTLLGAGGYVVPKRDGSLVVGATEEEVGFDARVTGEGLRQLLEMGARIVPAIGDCTFRSAWAGLRPTPSDGLPIIGPVDEVEGFAVATGHHRNGVLLSPATGELITGWVSGKATPSEARAFLPSRFTS
ncbi:MAG: glycine oxidase ThiO [Deltaproteobacteria bacterium]|nr:glycine oxidase ThiO [Deltaproteobacteria bacterium]